MSSPTSRSKAGAPPYKHKIGEGHALSSSLKEFIAGFKETISSFFLFLLNDLLPRDNSRYLEQWALKNGANDPKLVLGDF